MPNLDKIMSVSAGDIDKIMGVSKNNIETVMGLELGDPTWQGTKAIAMGRQLLSGSGVPAAIVRYVQMISRTISTSGSDAADFGDLDAFTVAEGQNKGVSSGPISNTASNGTVAVYWGGLESWDSGQGTFANQGQVITISSGADAVYGTTGFDFTQMKPGQASNGVVSHLLGGETDFLGHSNATDVGHKLTIGTSGSASASGDLTSDRTGPVGISHSTYGYFCGGMRNDAGATVVNNIEKISIGTDGNASDQGDLTVASTWASGSEDATRGVISCGWSWSGNIDTINYFSTDSGGNASDFGDNDDGQREGGAAGNGTICEFWGGYDSTGGATPWVEKIYYITVQSTGDAQDTGQVTSNGWDTINFSGTYGYQNQKGSSWVSMASGG